MFAIYIYVLILNVIVVHSDCDFKNIVNGNNYIVLRNFKKQYVLSTNTNFMVNGETVNLFCPSEFTTTKSGYEDVLFKKNLIGLSCRNDDLYDAHNTFRHAIRNEYNRYHEYHEHHPITCQSNGIASFYGTESEECPMTNLLYGFDILSVPIVLAEFCYDLDASKCDYAHYVVGKKSNILESLEKSNPTSTNITELNGDFEIFLSKEKLLNNVKLNTTDILIHYPFKDLLFEMNYRFDELAPSDLYLGYFENILTTLRPFISIPWWIPLKTGNWKLYERILKKEATNKQFEIYAGQSHVASYPENFVCDAQNEMKLDVSDRNDVVPLYIWNYIIPRNGGEEFVIIGINSPFVVANANNTMQLCEDMCDEIKWLTQLHVTRRLPTLGYMFCCKPQDVYDKLDGFPKKSFV